MCVAWLESLTQGFRRCCMPLGPTLGNIPMSWFWHGDVKSPANKNNNPQLRRTLQYEDCQYWFVDVSRITAPNLFSIYVPQPYDSPEVCQC